MSSKFTPAFPGAVKPVRIGVYQRRGASLGGTEYRYAYWNGEFWGVSSLFRPGAIDNRKKPSSMQSRPWRGLTKEQA